MVQQGQIAVIHFVGRLLEGENAGEVFDTTDVDVALEEGVYHDFRDYKPLEFRVGDGDVIDGIDTAVTGMKVGETKTVQLEPADAFGEYRPTRVGEVPREVIERRSDTKATEGALIRSETGEVGWITDVADDHVEVDFNHELAGAPVEFEIRLIDVYDENEE